LFWKSRSEVRLHWITEDLALSRQPGPEDWPSLKEQGIRSVVDLRHESEGNSGKAEELEMAYLRLPIVEGCGASPEDLESVAAWIDERTRSDGPVLVHCREGRGRSAMVALASLVRMGLPLQEAYRLTLKAQPAVALNAEQLDALTAFAERFEIREAGI
jgi:protein-tyrosine phosphatase